MHVCAQDVRGLEGIKEATVNLKPDPNGLFAKFDTDGKGMEIKVAVANGLGNAKKLVTELKAGNAKYDFVEVSNDAYLISKACYSLGSRHRVLTCLHASRLQVMACPAGCIGGGGQPRSTDKEILKKRQQAM